MAGLALALSVITISCGDNKTRAPVYGDYTGAPPTTLECVPNLDGKIEASEVRPAIGTPISYLVSPATATRPVNIAGGPDKNGQLSWSFDTDYADDQVATVMPQAITGKWYETSFPPDAFVTPFDAGGTVDNIARQTDQSLLLLGVASDDQSPAEGQTLLIYDNPVEILRFPIQPGTEFVSTGVVQNGTLRGLPYAGKDVYEVRVDAEGSVVLPSLWFQQAFRVRTKVTVQPAVGASTSRRQVSYFSECFAEVVRATSLPDEPNEDFTTAAELRRIGFN